MQGSGRYRVVRQLQRGGMAEVLEAFALAESGFERRVAIKRLLQQHSDDESFLKSFVDEARIASQLHHANIVAVIDFGVMDDLPFLVMELVDGPDLIGLENAAKKLGQKMPIAIALHIAVEVAHALFYAHNAKDARGKSMRIVHRDVSPENILVSWEGDIKLTDFGIARAKRRLEETAIGRAKGKLGYMAPEQMKGIDIDARADLFALGCVLHRLLAGRSPLDRAREDELSRGLVDADIDASLPDDVRRIVQRATRNERTERYANAADMAAECGAALAKRLAADARTTMRKWIRGIQPEPTEEELEAVRSAEEKKPRIVDLFQLELVAVEPSSLRRFASVLADPGNTDRSEIMATVVPVNKSEASADRVFAALSQLEAIGAEVAKAQKTRAERTAWPSSTKETEENPRLDERLLGAPTVVADAPEAPETRVTDVGEHPEDATVTGVSDSSSGEHSVTPTGADDSAPRPRAVEPEPEIYTPADTMIGAVLHGYRLVELIAKGTGSRIYRAVHLVLHRECAVKLLPPPHPELDVDIGAQRLRREAEVMARLSHPNIIQVFDFGTTPDGVSFLMMELLDGPTLGEVIRNDGPLDQARAASIAQQIASALAVAHGAGLIHRDLKAENVIILDAGRSDHVKVLDFGLARAYQPEGVALTSLTKSGMLLGTPAYMAPEQIKSPSTAGPKADLYSLGVILFEMLKGRRPFEGHIVQVLGQHLREPPPSLPNMGGLDVLASQLLQKDPSWRPESAQAVVEEIGRLSRGTGAAISQASMLDQTQVRPDPSAILSSRTGVVHPERLGPWKILAAVMLLAAAVLAGVYLALTLRARATPVVQVTAPAEPELPPAKVIPKPAVNEPESEVPRETAPRPARKKVPPIEELTGRLMEKMEARWLTEDDLRAAGMTQVGGRAWSLALMNAEPNLRQRTFDALMESIDAVQITAELVDLKLKRTSGLIARAQSALPQATVDEFESRYFAIQARAKSANTGAQRSMLARDLWVLERDVRRRSPALE